MLAGDWDARGVRVCEMVLEATAADAILYRGASYLLECLSVLTITCLRVAGDVGLAVRVVTITLSVHICVLVDVGVYEEEGGS